MKSSQTLDGITAAGWAPVGRGLSVAPHGHLHPVCPREPAPQRRHHSLPARPEYVDPSTGRNQCCDEQLSCWSDRRRGWVLTGATIPTSFNLVFGAELPVREALLPPFSHKEINLGT